MNFVIPNMIESVKGFDKIDSEIRSEDIRIVDPILENSQVTKITRGSMFTIAIMSMFGLTVIVSTLIVWKER